MKFKIIEKTREEGKVGLDFIEDDGDVDVYAVSLTGQRELIMTFRDGRYRRYVGCEMEGLETDEKGRIEEGGKLK